MPFSHSESKTISMNVRETQTRHDFKSQAAGQFCECSETEADLQLILLHTVNTFGFILKHEDVVLRTHTERTLTWD